MKFINESKKFDKSECGRLLILTGFFLMTTAVLTGCENVNSSLSNKTESTVQNLTEEETEEETNALEVVYIEEEETESESSDETAMIYQVTTSSSNLNVREEPDSGSAIIAKLANGEIVTGTGGISGEWIQVYCASDSDDDTGWVSKNFLSDVNQEQDSDVQVSENQASESQTSGNDSKKKLESLKWITEYELNLLNSGDAESISAELGHDYTEEELATYKSFFELIDQCLENGYVYVDETGSFAFTEQGEQFIKDKMVEYMYGQTGSDNIEIIGEEVQNTVQAQICSNCGGSGSVQTGSSIVCSICGGSGMQYIPNAMYDTIMGWQGTYVSCSGCGGSGYIGSATYETCGVCGGSGYVW